MLIPDTDTTTAGEVPRTTVVNIKYEEFDVYIGRPSSTQRGSVFANPFRIGPDGTRAEVIAKFRAHLEASPRLLAQVEGLRGKRLGCYCKPSACHGDIYVEILEGVLAPVVEEPKQRASQRSLF